MNSTRVRAIMLAIMLLIVPTTIATTTTGCVRSLPVLSDVAVVLEDAATILRTIDLTVRSFFLQADPAARTKYEKLMAGAYAGLGVASKTLQGVDDLTQEKYEEAFAKFKAAYAELSKYLQESGALKSTMLRLGGADTTAGTIDLPDPMALSYQVR